MSRLKMWLTNLTRSLHGTRGRAATGLVLLAMTYFMVAAASFSGFYNKWSFREEDPKFSFETMVDGEANRPFVYRQFLPELANLSEDILPDGVQASLTEKLFTPEGLLKSGLRSESALKPEYSLRYHLVFYGTFVFVFASLFAMRGMCLAANFAPLPSAVAPAIFALAFPYFQTVGGYFYDFPEVLFMALAVWISLRGNLLLLIPVAALATWNKESFLFFCLALYPLVRERTGLRGQAMIIGSTVLASGLVYLGVREAFAGNGGQTMEVHLMDNIKFYLNPLSLFGREITYELKVLAGYSIFTVIGIAIVTLRGWGALSVPLRRFAWLAAAINLPLFFLFCAPGEVRNLSMLSMVLVMLVAGAIQGSMARTDAAKHGAVSPA